MNLITGTAKIIKIGEIKQTKNKNLFLSLIVWMEYFGKKELRCWGEKAKIIHLLAKEKESIDYIAEWKEGEKGEIEFTLKNISRTFKMDEITIKEKTMDEIQETTLAMVKERIKNTTNERTDEEMDFLSYDEREENIIKKKICYRCGIVYEEDFERCPKCGQELDEADIENS